MSSTSTSDIPGETDPATQVAAPPASLQMTAEVVPLPVRAPADADTVTAPEKPQRPRRRRRWLRWLGTGLVAVTLAALAAGTVYFAHTSRANKRSAVKWRRRSVELNHLVAARTAELNQRDLALTKTAGQLTSLNHQVGGLEGRLRSLVSEKAQVEDQRGELAAETGELTTIASEQSSCSSGLSGLLQAFAGSDYIYVEANASSVGQSCQQAQSDFQTFEASPGQ